MFSLPKVEVLGASHSVTIVQGGMGACVSLAELAGAVAKHGGVGVVSTVGLDIAVRTRLGQKVSHYDAAKIEVESAIRLSGGNGLIGINCMALMHTYEASVGGAVAGGARAIFVGAGLPLTLPELVEDADVALVPIVSSARALEIICRKWQSRKWQKRYNRMPDAVVLEGPLAGGHLGFRAEDIEKPEFQLEEIFPPVLKFAQENGNFPVIVAGGIWDRADINRWSNFGAGVQLGTRFLVTHEAGASNAFKKAVVEATAEDIVIASYPGPCSPSRMPFRVIRSSPGYLEALAGKRTLRCDLGYMQHDGNCRAMGEEGDFCICHGLITAVGLDLDLSKKPIYTVGTNAYRVEKIVSVKELWEELTGFPS